MILEKNGRRIIIQAKRYSDKVGNKAVQEVSAAMSFYEADEGWVVTTSDYTSSARELAHKCKVRLYTQNDIETLFL